MDVRASVVRVAALAVTLSAAPLAFGKGQGGVVRLNDAMCEKQTGTCCREAGSICNAGGGDHTDYYYKEAGTCN